MKIPSETIWKEIKDLREKGLSYRKIGEMYGVSGQCIQQGLARRKNKFSKK